MRVLSAAEQVAEYLRHGFSDGKLVGELPGVHRLAANLGVNHKTVEGAMRILERDGHLVPQGAGKRRRIVRSADHGASRPRRVAILLFDRNDRFENYMVDMSHRLRAAGHIAFHPQKTLVDLDMKPERVSRLVEATEADAWVVQSGSREVLQWFAAREIPVLALFGHRWQVPIASVGPDLIPPLREMTRTLISLGHRRIVLLAWSGIRLPRPSMLAQAFLDELAQQGVEPSRYHLPDWKETVDGYYECLEALFRVTPPTALLVHGCSGWLATQQFLAAKRLRQPQDVSVGCLNGMPDFEWCRPTISHIRWDSQQVVNRIVRWAQKLDEGREDRRVVNIKAEFVPGGTIGPVAGK